jgi:hypothetical protein
VKDVIESLLLHAEGFRWLFLLALLWAFYRWMQGPNGLEWRDFISSRGADGLWHGDTNKLGQVTGIAFGSVSIVMISANAKSDFVGFAAVLTAYFAFVGGVAGYAAFLRSKAVSMQTTTVTEPATDQRTTTTVVEPSPKGDPKKKGKL